MAAQQELISAVRSMQANAQANLPVIPNNGNPNGAYNAPRVGQQLGRGKSMPNDFSWLEPSPAMRQLQDSMVQRQQYLDSMLSQIRQQPAPVMNESAPILGQQMNQLPMQQLPAIPMRQNAPLQNVGVVLPSTANVAVPRMPSVPQQGVSIPLPRMM